MATLNIIIIAYLSVLLPALLDYKFLENRELTLLSIFLSLVITIFLTDRKNHCVKLNKFKYMFLLSHAIS